MNPPIFLSRRILASSLFLAGLLIISANAQIAQQTDSTEQTSFSMDSPFEKPFTLSDIAKKALATDRNIARALKDSQLSLENIPKDWFLASEVHLGPKSETDLLVVGLGISQGPNRAGFWILRPTAQGYEISLATIAHDLTILETRTNRLRDIETHFLATAQTQGRKYEFDGQLYQKSPPAQGDQPSRIPDGVAQFTPEQLKNYYLVYTNSDVKYLRTLFDAYLKGEVGTDEEYTILDQWNKNYYRSKFVVLSRNRNTFGGTLITILFQERPDRIFVAWIYPEDIEGKLTLRGFDLGNFSDEDIRRTRVRYRELVEDTQHSM